MTGGLRPEIASIQIPPVTWSLVLKASRDAPFPKYPTPIRRLTPEYPNMKRGGRMSPRGTDHEAEERLFSELGKRRRMSFSHRKGA